MYSSPPFIASILFEAVLIYCGTLVKKRVDFYFFSPFSSFSWELAVELNTVLKFSDAALVAVSTTDFLASV